MSSNLKENQFSPDHSRSPSPSLEIKASSPEEEDPNANEMVDLIDNYEDKKPSPLLDMDQDFKDELNAQSPLPEKKSPLIEPLDSSSNVNPLKRKSSEDIESNASLKKVKKNVEVPITSELKEKEKLDDLMEIPIDQESNDEDLFDAEIVIRKKKTLKDDFEPGSFEPDVIISEGDIEIIKTDIPERLQSRVRKGEEHNNEAIMEEAKWICEQFKSQRNSFPNDNLMKKVQKVLGFLKVSHYEVLFQNFYRKNELFPEIQLSELWEIFDLDEEWDKLRNLKSCVKANLKLLENFMEIPKSILEFVEQVLDKTSLNNLQDYTIFHLSKYLEGEDMQQKISIPDTLKEPFPKKAPKRVFVYEALQLKLDQFANVAGLTSEELGENIGNDGKTHKKTSMKKPRYVAMKPETVAQEYINPGKPLVNDILMTLTNLCRFMASEIFQDPIIRQHLKKLYFENVTLSTEPTLKGNKELDIFNPYYIVKRINRRPPGDFQDDLWLKMMKSEKDDLIKIRVILPWEEDLKNNKKDANDMKDEIYNSLLKLYIGSLTDVSDQEKDIIIQWNIVRGEVLRIYLTDLLYPFFEKTLKDELTDVSEKFVVTYCGKKLKDLLNTAPYLVSREEDLNNMNNGRNFIKPKVVSVVLEISGNNQQNSNKISFVAVGSDGLFLENLTLKFFAIQNIDTQNASIKENYDKDYSEFEKFMIRHQPDLVIVSGNCLDSRRIRQMMINFRDDYLKSNKVPEYTKPSEDSELLKHNISNSDINMDKSSLEPMVQNNNLENSNNEALKKSLENPIGSSSKKAFNIIYGDNIVPSLFAKTRKAEFEFKGASLSIKEGVSLARFAQNPLAEILNLWSEKNQENALFYIPFHPLQNQITLARLRKEFEKIVLEAVNTVGVDFNEAIKFDHLSSSLQFVCGLGPKKAANLIETLKNKSKSDEFQGLRARNQFITERLMEKKVFTNCAGFLKIEVLMDKNLDFDNEKRPESLDITRIHPDNYSLAKKIAKDALDEDSVVNVQDLIPKIMRNSFKLKELDLEDYANHMASLRNKPNMIFLLNFIVEELIFPFRDPRNIPFLYSPKDIFYKLSKESPENFRVNSIMNAKIIRVLKSNLLCKLENGLGGSIYYLDIFEKKEGGSESLNQFFEEGQFVKTKVKSIDFEKFRIELTMRPSELKPHKNQLKDLFPNYWENLAKFFKISKFSL